MTAKVSFVSLFLALATFSTSHAGVTDCLNVAYEGEIETVNGLAASTYTLPRLKFHVIFHQDGSISYTESALFKANDVVGERTAIGNWEEKDESVAFTLFQSVVDQSNALFFGCDDYACKNTILGKLDFAPDCSTFTFNWSQTILGEDGQPAPSLSARQELHRFRRVRKNELDRRRARVVHRARHPRAVEGSSRAAALDGICAACAREAPAARGGP